MALLDRFPLPVLKGMRDGIAVAVPDDFGMIYQSIPNVKRREMPYQLSTNKAASLNMIEAAIARRGATAGEAKQ